MYIPTKQTKQKSRGQFGRGEGQASRICIPKSNAEASPLWPKSHPYISVPKAAQEPPSARKPQGKRPNKLFLLLVCFVRPNKFVSFPAWFC